MPRIGLLVCAYDCERYIARCLEPWIGFSGLEIHVVSTLFKGYEPKSNSNTLGYLNCLLAAGKINSLSSSPAPMEERDARNLALTNILGSGCDYMWMLDGDEIYTRTEINSILNTVETTDYFWYWVNFKNYVFDGTKWIDGFCVPRIFRIKHHGLSLQEFYWDNDLRYSGGIDYKALPNYRIPTSIAHVGHMTWLHWNGKEKVEYQMRHFGSCSYRWNEAEGKLEFNPAFYPNGNFPQLRED